MVKQKEMRVMQRAGKGAARPCGGMFPAFGFLLSSSQFFCTSSCFHSFVPSIVGEGLICAICPPTFKGVSQEVLLSSLGFFPSK